MLLILGYIGALFIGLILGLTGGGGSILTVPILVYILGLSPVTATAYSLFVVGTTSAFGTILNFRKEIVEVKTAFIFAIPSLIAVFLTRKFLVPALPETFLQINSFTLTKSAFLMVLFAVVMFLASVSMLKAKSTKDVETVNSASLVLTIIKITLVGVLIGLVGAGGGFLIVPALVFIARLPMKKAVGTSLLVIALNSLVGFIGDLGNQIIDWEFLMGFSAVSVIGIYLGIFLNKYVNEKMLKKGFGWFVLIMALFIFSKELLLK